MALGKTIDIVTEEGEAINIPLFLEGEREATVLMINGVQYHLERILRQQFVSRYRVDSDPDYDPQEDAEGFCYILAPFSR